MSQSEWSKIKVYKGPADAKRSAIFTRMARLITVAAREGGGDQNFNFKLRSAVERALSVNMPKDSIERAVKKGTGELAAENIEEVIYEGFGPGGVAVLIEALTDSRNRTSGNIKHAFSSNGGALGATGAVQWMFERLGVVRFKAEALTDESELALIDAGANDVQFGDGAVTVSCPAEALSKMRGTVEKLGFTADSASLTWKSKDKAPAASPETRKELDSLFETLEEDEDVSAVYSNIL